MLWGSFGVVHLFSLVLSVAIIVGLFFMLRKRSKKVQTIVLGILSFSGIAAIIFNLVKWGSPLEYLPLHLCSLNAMVLPVAVLTKNKVLSNLLLFWALGALLALVINTAQANFEIFSLTFAMYYFPHTLELGIPILLFVLKMVKLDVKCIIWTIVITLACFTIIHFINVGLNAYFIKNNVVDYAGNILSVNYMYSIKPENPVLQLFYNLIPQSFWYMFLSLPLIVIYLGAIYCKEIIKIIKNKKAKKVY
jgi:uncharacterized membrane protein YwaF